MPVGYKPERREPLAQFSPAAATRDWMILEEHDLDVLPVVLARPIEDGVLAAFTVHLDEHGAGWAQAAHLLAVAQHRHFGSR